MKLDKEMVELICELEYKIGFQTYNPNSYNGWTGEEGCSYKYPVNYCETKKDLKERNLTKTKAKIRNIDPECIETMKYAFGSNHLYIGDGIVNALSFIENRYGIDFNELEQQYVERRKEKMQKLQSQINDGNEIHLSAGRYIVGIDIPDGEYTIFNPEDAKSHYLHLYIYFKNGNEKRSLFSDDKEYKIKLKMGESIMAHSSWGIK